jgi:asparagine synthase (glutamine-hydrolysing)
MCGIVGILTFDGAPASPVVLRRMTAAVAHRGPDGEGHFAEGVVGLGNRRLAVIDPTPAGHQPMATADGRFVINYNGEIYNFTELRVELEALGRRFRSRSDTEVVLEAIAEWGLDAFQRFDGMFALAVWDRERRELTLARDRYGIKPLYLLADARKLIFASEIKGLLEHPDMKVVLDRKALLEYFTFQNVFSPRTLFAGVELLAAGTCLVARADGSRASVRYWDFSFSEPDDRLDEAEYLEELDRLFCQAVSRQLVADVPVSSYLSGGMDSGSITAIAAGQIPQLRTFTVGFDLSSASGLELGFDERESAEHMSYVFGTEHYEMVLKAGDMERVMPRLVWHLEDLRVGQCYPNFYAAQLASKFAKVVLSGAGGDELFGGYPWRYYRAVVNDDFDHYVDKYYDYWQRLLTDDESRSVFRPIWADIGEVQPRELFRSVFPQPTRNIERPEDYINLSLYLEAKTFLHGLLVVEDKLSMAHGLETRVPFLDNDVVSFAERLPVDLKLGNLRDVISLNENEPGPKTQRFFERTRDGKLLLRRAMERHVPAQVTSRVKQGFAAPDASWFRGESIDYVRRRLLDPHARIYEYLDPDATRALVVQHLDGVQNRRLLVWSLLSVEQWCRTFLDAERPE